MINYTGCKCLICEKTFTDSDDIVVCPTCGTPYHRDCYLEKGECVQTELHENNLSWTPTYNTEPDPRSSYEIKDKECPSCGILNYHSSTVCTNCDKPLTGEEKPPYQSKNPYQAEPMPFNFPGIPNPFDPMGGISPSDTLEDDINYGEVSKLVERNTAYYMPVFKRLKTEKRKKFSLVAFLFTGPWLLYRKMYKQGIIITIIMFALYLSQTFATVYILMPTISDLALKAGLDIMDGLTTGQIFTAMQYATNTEMLLLALPGLLSISMLVIMIIMGNIANKMYMKHCIKTIKTLREKTKSPDEYDAALSQKSGVNTSITYCIIICYFLSTYLPMLLL